MILTDREQHLIGLAIVMKIRHFEKPEVSGQFDNAKVKSCIKEYEDILKLIRFKHYNRITNEKG